MSTENIQYAVEHHVVEWSRSQRCINIQTLGDSIEDNEAVVIEGCFVPDWVIIRVCTTYEQAKAYAKEIEPWLQKKTPIP